VHQPPAALSGRSPMQGCTACASLCSSSAVARHASMQQATAVTSWCCMDPRKGAFRQTARRALAACVAGHLKDAVSVTPGALASRERAWRGERPGAAARGSEAWHGPAGSARRRSHAIRPGRTRENALHGRRAGTAYHRRYPLRHRQWAVPLTRRYACQHRWMPNTAACKQHAAAEHPR